MAFHHGKDAYLSINSVDISTFTDTVGGLPNAAQLSEVTAFGASGTAWIKALENATWNAAGSWDDTESTGLHATMVAVRASSTPVTFEYGPGGNGSGAVKLSGVCWMTNYEVAASVSEKVPYTADFQVNGTVTIGTFA